jgi:hypothetical protein
VRIPIGAILLRGAATLHPSFRSAAEPRGGAAMPLAVISPGASRETVLPRTQAPLKGDSGETAHRENML